MNEGIKNSILEDFDKNFIISLFEIIIQIYFDNFKLKLNNITNIKDLLKNINQKYNINNFINKTDNEFNLNLEIFLKNKFNDQIIPITLLNVEYNNIKKDEFQMIEMLYLKYDEKIECFLSNLLITWINYLLTFPFIGFNYLKDINTNYLSKLHKYFIFDFIIYSDHFENSLAKFNKNSKFFSNEKFNYEYSIENKEVFIKILNINPSREDILNFINSIEIKKNNNKGRSRILSGENYKIYNKIKEKRDRKSNNEFELKEIVNKNNKELSISISPPFVLQSEDLLNNWKKNSTVDLNSDSSEKDEEYTLVSFRNRDEFGISFSKKSKNDSSSKNIDKILRDNSGSISLGNDLDSFFSYVKYSKYKLSNLYKEQTKKEIQEETNNNENNIIFDFDNIYKFKNFEEFMENFNN